MVTDCINKNEWTNCLKPLKFEMFIDYFRSMSDYIIKKRCKQYSKFLKKSFRERAIQWSMRKTSHNPVSHSQINSALQIANNSSTIKF